MLHAWNANMDIQLALDTYTIITYSVSYMNKDETQMTKFMREALNSVAKENAKEKLKTLKMTYLTHWQVGAAEATYRILPGMRLKDSNVSCIFVTTGFPETRSRFYKKVVEDDEIPEKEVIEEQQDEEDPNVEIIDDNDIESDGAAPNAGGRPERIAGREGLYVESTTVHDRYAARPRSENLEIEGKLEKLCLA